MSTPEPRVHPMLAAELARLLEHTKGVRASKGETAEVRRARWIATELEFLGWKVAPSHQRRHQIERGIL